MGLWSLVGVLFVFKIVDNVVMKLLQELKLEDCNKYGYATICLIGLISLILGIFWLTPLFFNTLFSYFGVDKIVEWKEAFVLNLVIGLKYIPINTNKK